MTLFLNNNEKPKRINVVIYKGKSFKFTVRLQFIYNGTYLYYSTLQKSTTPMGMILHKNLIKV